MAPNLCPESSREDKSAGLVPVEAVEAGYDLLPEGWGEGKTSRFTA